MIKTEQVRQRVTRTISIVCDRCGREDEAGGPEAQEYLVHSDVGGWGSVFGDGTKVDLDLCQHCTKELLGQWIRTSRP